jgi:hypothetical protein
LNVSPKNNLRFGVYDGDLAVWNDLEAWVATNGTWYRWPAFHLWDNARINVEGSFIRQLIAEAPPLPVSAFAQKLAQIPSR